MNFKQKVVVITGGSSGIGLALAEEFAARDSVVCISSRSRENLDQALSRLVPIGSAGKTGIVCDVSDPLQVDQLVDEVINQVGPPDILINSAGVAHPGRFSNLDPEIFEWMMETNFYGTLFPVKGFLPAMQARGSGYIVNFGSIAAYVGLFGYSAYGASKFAVRGFSEALRMELKPQGIHVSFVIPPDTNTPQLAYENQFKPLELKYLFPAMGVIQPEQVARAVIKGIERRRFEIVPDLGSQGVLTAIRLSGPLLYSLLDWLLGRATQRIRREKSSASVASED